MPTSPQILRADGVPSALAFCHHPDKLEFVYQNPYNEYISIPRPADMTIISIGDGFFFSISLATMLITINKANIIMPLRSIASVSPIPLKPIAVLMNIVIAVASIKPMMHGRMPPRNAFTPAYFNKLRIRAAITRMITNDGNTTPSVARIAAYIISQDHNFFNPFRMDLNPCEQ